MKDYVSVSKGVHKKSFLTCKNLCNLQELYTAFKEKHPNVNIGFSKFATLRSKWCVMTGSKITHSVFVVLIKMLCCCLMQRTGIGHAKTWSRRPFTTLRATNASYINVNPVLVLQLWKNVLIRPQRTWKW